MPVITVQTFPGRTAEQKAALAGQSRESVRVVIDEVAREHWAAGGTVGTQGLST